MGRGLSPSPLHGKRLIQSEQVQSQQLQFLSNVKTHIEDSRPMERFYTNKVETRTSSEINAPLLLDRRKVLGSLGLVVSPSLFLTGCSLASSDPEGFRERQLVSPMSVKDYRTDYEEPVGKFKTKAVNFEGHQRTIHYYRPTGNQTQKKSVLLLLHGRKRSGPSLLDKWTKIADQNNILLVAPDSLSKEDWSLENDSIVYLESALAAITAKSGFESATRYGFGHSVGAVMLTALSIQHGSFMTKIAVHAGSVSPRLAAKSKKVTQRKTPIAHFLGTEDHSIGMRRARRSAKILAKYGQLSDLITIKGHNHWYYDLAPFINEQAWKFLTASS